MLNDKIRPAMNREFDPAETGVDVLIVDDPYGGGGFYFGPSSNETATSGFNPGRFMYDGSKPTQMYVYCIQYISIGSTAGNDRIQMMLQIPSSAQLQSSACVGSYYSLGFGSGRFFIKT